MAKFKKLITVLEIETKLTKLADFAQHADLDSISLYVTACDENEREEILNAIKLLQEIYSK